LDVETVFGSPPPQPSSKKAIKIDKILFIKY